MVVKQHIERDLTNFKGEKFKMRSEASAGNNWGKYDTENPDKNPNGMKELTDL